MNFKKYFKRLLFVVDSLCKWLPYNEMITQNTEFIIKIPLLPKSSNKDFCHLCSVFLKVFITSLVDFEWTLLN